ncbi:biotin/lipoyl-binding protein [Chloroflexales bacterium ZM16-3]|nr:biotin/lipoyl-binding protein [Chloroflexales bacterium ZM16-3]
MGLLLVSASLLAACASPPPPTEPTLAPTAVASPVPDSALSMPTPLPRTREGGIQVSGHVVPASSVNIYPTLAQMVSEVFVREGDMVQAGDPLLSYDPSEIQIVVQQAEAMLREERANYESLRASATPAQINAAKAQVARAQAQLRQTELKVTPGEVAAAESRLASARAELVRLQKSPNADDIAVKQAKLDNAKANLQSVRDSWSATKNESKADLEKAANHVRELQLAYENIYWRNRNIENGGGNLTDRELQDEQLAKLQLDNTQLDLQIAQLNYDKAQKNEVEVIKASEAAVSEAQAQLNLLYEPADPNEIEAAQKQVDEAQIQLNQLKGDRYQSTLDEARANLAYNEAVLAQLSSDPSASELARTEARIANAEAALDRAKYNLDRLVVRSPITGQVVQVGVDVGVYANADRLAIVIADLSNWTIQIDEVNELDVVEIREGDRAMISFMALPGFQISGKVSQIEAIGQRADRQIGARYQVLIAPETWDDRLRWDMTATVEILTQSQ